MITRRRLVGLLIGLLLASPSFAQTKPTGPRAVGVLEWTPQGLRLLPISLVIDGRFYDAALYRANPVPMAVDQDTVYEVQKAGDMLGDFTITEPAQLPNGVWIGQGFFESEEGRKKKAEDRAKAAATAASVKPVDPNDERPVLRRGSAKPDENKTPAPATAPSTPAPAPATTATSPQPAAPATPPAKATTNEDDRPILQRGKPKEEQAVNLGKDTLPHKATPKPPEGIDRIQVAVSDAGSSEPRPYAWKWNQPEEEKKYRSEAEKLALELVRDYARKTGGPEPGKLEISGWNAFDLAYNNDAEVILTAKVTPAVADAGATRKRKAAAPPPSAPAGFVYYVTLVAQEDIYGQLQKNFVAVTDSKHLDAFPRYELIDAVDADGDHNGELLFRRVNDVSSSFVLYRVYGNSLNELLRVPEPKEISAGQ